MGRKETIMRRGISRRDFLKIGGAGIAGAALLGTAACGGGNGGGAGGGGDSGASEGSIEVWIMQPGSDELEELVRGFSDEFVEANSGAEVNVQFVPWASAHDRFVTAIGGGQVPDVAEMGTTWTPEFGALGAFSSVDEQLTGDYISSLVESGTVQGTAYGLPWYGGARSLIFRSDVLEDLGLEPPATWDDIVTVGEAIMEETEMFPFGAIGDYRHQFLPMVWQAGGEIAVQNGDTWESRMDSPEAIEAFEFYASLFRDRQFAPEGALTWNSVDLRGAFENGDFAMMVGGGWDVPAITSSAPDLEGSLGTSVLPEGPGGNPDTFAGGSHLVVFEESQNKELATAFAEFMLEPERVSQFTEQLGFLPGTTEGVEQSGYEDDETLAPFAQQITDYSRTYPPTPEWGGFEGETLFVNAMQEIMQGDRGAEEALAEVANTMNEEFGSS